MKQMTRDVIGRAFLFAGLTAAMYYLHLLSWKYEKKRGWKGDW